MTKNLSEKLKKEISELYEKGSTIREIVELSGVSYSSVYAYTRAKERGFGSYTEYEKYLAKQRQQRTENKKLSELIIERLVDMDKTQSWLAGQLEVTEQAVSYYVNGMCMPKNKTLSRLLSILNIDKKEDKIK